MKTCSCFFALMIFVLAARAQDLSAPAAKPANTKGRFYFGLGFHRIYFTRSDIRFRDQKTANYDFTLERVKATDDNSFDFGEGIDAPQYSYRIGYYFGRRKDLGIEFSFDHAKYIAVQNQRVHIRGQINGTKLDQDTTMHNSLVEYEHTDGANYYMLSFLKRKSLLQSRNGKHQLGLVLKPGIGFVFPRSDTRVIGMHRDDQYHVAGYVIGADAALRYDFFRNFYLETSLKAVFANYNDVLLYGEGRASQKWWSLQTIVLLGFQFPL